MSKVLVIDDTPEYIEMLDDLLPYEVYAAINGQKGLELAEKVKPDIILLDINMPTMNGYDVCRKLKINKELRSIPVIFLTSNEGSDFEEIGFNMGAVDYISKPFNATVLQARVKTHLDLHTLQKNLRQEVDDQVRQIKNMNQDMVLLCASIAEMKSKETGQHLKRVSNISYHLANFLNRNDFELDIIKIASILHDIGKVGIPDSILNKPSSLDEQEWKIMKNHCQLGYDFLKDSDFEFMRQAAIIALEHHERWDGTGYPNGLKTTEISFVGRLVAVADVFDSLLDERVYKEAWEPKKVQEYFEQMQGKQFDPEITNILLENFDIFLKVRDEATSLKMFK